MKLSKKLLLITALLLLTTSCLVPNGLFDIFPILSKFPGLAEEEPDKDGGDDSMNSDFLTYQEWICSASDLRVYQGDEWQPYQNLNLKLYLRDSTFTFDLDFRSESTFLVQRDPDYRPPPGTTLVPEGEYKFEEFYLGGGEVTLDAQIYSGTTALEYTQKTHFSEPVVTEGKIAFQALGHFIADDSFRICLDVYEGGFDEATRDPLNQLAPNCRWPGYIFSCITAQ